MFFFLAALIAVLSVLALGATAVVVVRARRARAAAQREDASAPGQEPAHAHDLEPGPALDERLALPPRLPPRPAPPIVLVHGLLGFDHIALLRWRFVYFRGIVERLRDAGATVYTVRLPPLASVPQRAQALTAFVRALPHERVSLVAHSMGGLDARYAVARLGLHTQVTSLVTIATPHQGTPLADLGAMPPLQALRLLVGRVGLQTEALDWLTSARAGTFNRDIADVAGVRYGSVVARANPGAILVNPVLLSGLLYLHGCAGANDGMVPVTSQRWGEVIDEIDADHWAQIGWSRYFDAAQLYLRLLDHLRGH